MNRSYRGVISGLIVAILLMLPLGLFAQINFSWPPPAVGNDSKTPLWTEYSQWEGAYKPTVVNVSLYRSDTLLEGQEVRVHLLTGSTIKIQPSGTVYVYNAPEDPVRKKLKEPGELTAKIQNGVITVSIKSEQVMSGEAVIIDPEIGTTFTIKDLKNDKLAGRKYSGVFYLVPGSKSNQMWLIEHLNLEEYLPGVVAREIGESNHLEALKAQAVVARTYARKKMAKKEPNFDLLDTPTHQAYIGLLEGRKYDNVKKAVQQTKGEILVLNGSKILDVLYHSNCGGYTIRPSEAGWGGSPRQDQYGGVQCGYCAGAKNSCWSASIPQETVDKFVHANSDLKGAVTSIKIEERESRPEYPNSLVRRVLKLKFITTDGSVILPFDSFKASVSDYTTIKSCKLEDTIELSRGKFSFNGRGFGHGVGMCQEGAKGMAGSHKTYKEILLFYFQPIREEDVINITTFDD